MGLGPIHTTNLAEARVRARQMRQLILDGKDPLGVKRDAITAERIAAAKQCADEFLRTSPVAKTWTNDVHRKQWRQTLEDYAFPVLGAVPVGQIDVALVKKALTPIWNDAPVTASRLRGRIELVLVYATASGLREGDNPAAWRGNLKAIFGRPPQQEHPRGVALRRTAGIYAALARDRPARAVEFMILTGVRLSEARNAAWETFGQSQPSA